MKSVRAPWKCRAVETVESQKQASHRSHSPWKSLARFPIPTAPAGRGKVQNQMQVLHFPTCCLIFFPSHTGFALCDHSILIGSAFSRGVLPMSPV